MTIYSTLLTNIRVSALSGLANRMVAFYETKDLTAYPDYAHFTTSLKELSVQFNTALNQEKALSELADLDAIRDNSYRSLYQMVQAYSNAPSAEIVEAADRVFAIFSRYGLSIMSMAYDDETGMLDSLLTDLSSEDLASDIVKLPFVTSLIEELQAAESNFKGVSNLYEQSKASQKEGSPAASKLKAPLLIVINKHIVNYHTALAAFKGEVFGNIANTLEGMIESENIVTRSRLVSKEV